MHSSHKFVYFALFFFGITSLLATPITSAEAAPTGKSDFPSALVQGIKWPNSREEGDAPVVTEARIASSAAFWGFTALHEFILPSPDQQGAGSCLYMSLTGIAEWWLAKLHPTQSRASNGPLDLSERYLMNLSGADEASNPKIENWKTDSIELFNLAGDAVLNTAYPFTMGWSAVDSKGDYVHAEPNSKGATYGPEYNWLDDRDSILGGLVKVPKFSRKVVFADPEDNQWNVGTAPDNIVQQVKDILVNEHVPVQVIYNHYGYWHSVFVVGFDDKQNNENCKFVNGFRTYMKTEAQKLRNQAAQTSDQKEKDKILARAEKFTLASKKVEASWNKSGGCSGQGVFHVRDSIYGAPSEPIYDYDSANDGEEAPYSQKIVTHEYEWLRHLANHVVVIKPTSSR